ncbi:MAG: hypothetical protein RIE77_01755 [Phycisphaerales bacterium]
MKSTCRAVVTLLVIAPFALAQPAEQHDAAEAAQPRFEFMKIDPGSSGYRGFERAIFADFVDAAQGDADAKQRLVDACTQAIEVDSENAEAIAWRGAARMFDAGSASEAGDFMAAMRHTNEALADLDRARDLEPENPGVRVVTATTLLNLAAYHPIDRMAKGYAAKGVEDAIAALSKLYENWNEQPIDLKGQLMIGVAWGYDRMGETTKARDWFNRVIGAAPGTTWAEQAQAWIDAADKRANEF